MKYRKASFALGTLILVSMAAGAFAKEHGSEKPVTGTISTTNLNVKDYPTKAQVSSVQATQAATAAVPGQVLSVALEKEDGFLVYAVEIVDHDSNLHEVNVDAGNGKVLSSIKKSTRVSEREENDEEDDD